MKKKLLAVILVVAMLVQVGGVSLLSFAEESSGVTITISDENGNVIYEGTADGDDSIDTRWIDSEFSNLDEKTREAIQKDGTVIKINGNLVEKSVTVGENDNGDSQKVTITGNTQQVTTMDEANVTVVGDVSNSNGWAIEADYDGNNYKDNASTIVVKGNVTGSDSAIMATGNANVTVNGNVISTDGNGVNASDAFPYDDVISENNSIVVVNGNIKADNDGVYAESNAQVTVNGNITAGHHEDNYSQGTGVTAKDDAKITVIGNIESSNDAIRTEESSGTVQVEGNISSSEAGGIHTIGGDGTVSVDGNVTSTTGIGIYAENNWEEKGTDSSVKISVSGDVKAKQSGVEAEGTSNIKVDGNVTSTGDVGIRALTTSDEINKATIVVDGNVTSRTDGIVTTGAANITVGGDVTSSRNTGIYARNDTYNGVDNASTIKVEGDVNAQFIGIWAQGDAKITVDGDVTAAEGQGIQIQRGDEAKVSVGGDVTADSNGVYISGKGTVDVDGNVTSENRSGVYIQNGDGASITVGGDISSHYSGVGIQGEGKVEVGGDVTSDLSPAIDVMNLITYDPDTGAEEDILKTATVVVDGDATSKKDTAVVMGGEDKVTIWGDVTGGYIYEEAVGEADEAGSELDNEPAQQAYNAAYLAAVEEAFKDVEIGEYFNGAVMVYLNEEDNSGSLIVGGTITANEGSVPVVLNYTVTDEADAAKMPDLPAMKIYEIAPDSNGEYFNVNVALAKSFEFSYENPETGETHNVRDNESVDLALSSEDHNALIEAVAAAIEYIIKIGDVSNGSINIDNKFYDAENGIYTAHEGEAVSVTISANTGYTLNGVTATGNYTLVNNGDGTWTLTVLRGGGVTISANISQQAVSSDSSSRPAVVNNAAPAAQKTRMTDDEISNAISDLLTKDGVGIDAKVSVLTAADGSKTVVIEPAAEITEEGNVVLQLAMPADMLDTLSESDVSTLVMKNSDGTVEVNLPMEDLLDAVAGKTNAELVVVCEEKPEIAETVLNAVNDRYTVLDTGAVVVKVLIREEDGTESELNSANFSLRLMIENQEGMRILYIDEDGNITEAAAVWVAATADTPAHWEVPFMGNGSYLPVIEK